MGIENIIMGGRGFDPFEAISRGKSMAQGQKLADIAFQQKQIALQNARAKQEEDKLRRERSGAFRQDFQDMGYTQGASDPRELQDLYMEHYPEQVAQQQMRQSMKAQDPYALQKLQLRQQAEERRGEQLGINQQRVDVSKDRVRNLNSRLELANKTQDWRAVEKIKDRIFNEKEFMADEADRDWKNKFKSPYEYSQKQTQLAGQVPSSLQANYRGTIANGGEGAQDLTPLAIKEVTGATEGVSKILRSTDKLMDMVGAQGLQFLPGKEKAKMETLLSDMALTYKGEEFAGLGVLTGPDLDILLDVMGNPTKLSGLTADIQSAKLNEFREMLLAGYAKKLDARGFNPISPDQIKGVGGTGEPKKSRAQLARDRAAKRKGK